MNELNNAEWNAAVKKQGRRFELTGYDRGFSFVMLILGVAFIALGLFKGLFFGFSLIFTLIFISVSVYLTKKDVRPDLFHSVCGGLALTGGAVYTVCTDVTVKFLLIPILFVLCVIWFSGLSGIKIPAADLGIVSVVWKNGVGDSIKNVPASAASLADAGNNGKRKSIKVLIGALFALPVAFIVVSLLSKADSAFDTMIAGIKEKAGAYIGYFVCGFILCALVVSFCFSLKKRPPQTQNEYDHSRIDKVYTGTFLTLLSVCYIAYLFSQLAYFTGAFKDFLPDGFSYSEYARKGFFELCAVSVINLVIIFAAIVFTRKNEGKIPVYVKCLSIFISIFTLFLCASSVAKMLMYIKIYGLTVLRVGTSVFMAVIAVVFAAMILRTFSSKIKVLHTAVIASSTALILLGLVNTDSVVARYNYNAYLTGKLKTVDVYNIASCGAEGVPYLELLTHVEDEKTAFTAAYELKEAVYMLYDYDYGMAYTQNCRKGNRSYKKLSQFNTANKRAYEILESFDFSAYDFDKIDEEIIQPYYESLYYDDIADTEESDQAEGEKVISAYTFSENEKNLNTVIGIIVRELDCGTVSAGDELEMTGRSAPSVSVVNKTDRSLIPLTITAAEAESIVKVVEGFNGIYKIKIYSNSIRFCKEKEEDDCLVYSLNGSDPAESFIGDSGNVMYYSSEWLGINWYKLSYLRTEKPVPANN